MPPNRDRRKILAAAGALLAGGYLVLDDDPPARRPARWPSFQSDDRNSGWAPNGDGPTGDLEPLWHESLSRRLEHSTPVLGDGNLYVLSNPDDTGRLEARDPATGQVRWGTDLEHRAESPLALGDDRLFFGGDRGGVWAFDAADGERLWRTEIATYGVGAPIVGDGTVYAARSDVRALDPTDGSELWRQELPAATGAFLVGGTSLALADDLLYVRAAGSVRYESEPNALYAFDPADGSLAWQTSIERPAEQVDLSSPTVGPEYVYVYVEAEGYGVLHAFDRADGSPAWTFEVDDPGRIGRPGGPTCSPAVTDESVYLATSDDRLYALTTAGERRWSRELRDRVLASPVVVDGTIYVADYSYDLYGFDESGTELLRANPSGSATTPVVGDGRVHLLAGGSLWAFG